MITEEILIGNKLIAEFMDDDVVIEIIIGFGGRKGTDIVHHSKVADWNKTKMYYHSSWDRLMPVVEKIENQGTIVEIWLALGKGCRIVKGSFKVPVKTITTTESNSTIEAVWLAVVDYIKWYNEHGK